MQVHALRTSRDEPDESSSYRIHQRLAEVSTAVTCIAEAPPPGSERVCLRFAKRRSDDAVLERFRRFRASVSGFDHPELPLPHAAGLDWAGRPYFAMDAVEGQEIRTHCDARGFDPEKRLSLIAEACEAVARAHHRGLSHGAIEPGDLIVCDRPARSCVRVLGAGTIDVLGTHADLEADAIVYRSPEQVMGASSTDAIRSDVYALGAIAYELMVGALPHDPVTLERARKMGMLEWTYEDGPLSLGARACTLGERTALVARNRGLDPEGLRSLMGTGLQGVIERALSPDPGARHADAGELGRAFRSLQLG